MATPMSNMNTSNSMGMGDHHMAQDEKMMTIEDITKKFHEELEDEIHDSNMYYKMSIAAKTMGQPELAHGLYMISRDEYTHAKFICKMLKHNGEVIPPEAKEMLEALKERFRGK